MSQAAAARKLRVLIGGGTGFIGRHLKQRLTERGHEVSVISRTSGPGKVTWDEIKQKKSLPIEVDACVQLSGSNIMESTWTDQRKTELRESRAGVTAALVEAIKNTKNAPNIFVTGSAIGYYPTNPDGVYDEYYTGPPANDFSGSLCDEWEKTSASLEQGEKPLRRSIIRTGVVLAKDEGALKSMILPLGLSAGTVASGQQWMPWIHIDDIVEMFTFAIENDNVKGVLNGTAPTNVTNAEFSSALAAAANRWPVPTPEFLANFMFGERATLLTRGSKVLPKRALELGFKFKYNTVDEALRACFSSK